VPDNLARIPLAGKPEDIVTPVRADDAFARQKRQLVNTNRPLTEVAGDPSRYMREPIRGSPAHNEKRVSGAFDLRDIRSLRHQLELVLPVRFRDDAGGGVTIVPSGVR